MRYNQTKIKIETCDEAIVARLRPYFDGSIYSFEGIPFVFFQYQSSLRPNGTGMEMHATIEFQEVIAIEERRTPPDDPLYKMR